MSFTGPRFGWMTGPVGSEGESDAALYRQMVADAELGASLGYDAIWFFEHHFSNYYPTPSPLLMLANIAARCPGFGLGTAVLVAPWYHPLRMAEEISMLSLLTDAPLYIGLGRGNAPMEYEAFGVPMAEAQARFDECLDIVRLALKGRPFSYKGQYLQVEREVVLRPTPRMENVTLLGAIGQPSSAAKLAARDLPPMQAGHTPLADQKKVLAAWDAAARQHGARLDVPRVGSPITIIADTDREAADLARRYVPNWYKLQVEHYAYDAERYANLPTYQPFNETHKRRRIYTDPDNLGPLIENSFIGSAETVRKKAELFLAAGFNYILVNPSLPGLPHHLRQDWLTRFARDVMPHLTKDAAAAGRHAEPRSAAQ